MSEPTLDFEAAMRDFVHMFPDLDRTRIESVLRKNEGNVAETIDELLAITAVKEKPPPVTGKSQRPPSVSFSSMPSSSGPAASSSQRGQEVEKRRAHSHSSAIADQCLDDARLAAMLQNEEFLRFVNRDRHLARELRHGEGSSRRSHEMSGPLLDAVPDGPLIPGSSSSSSSLRKRLSDKVMNRLRKTSEPSISGLTPATSHADDASAETHEESVGYDPFPYTKTVGYRSDSEGLSDRLRNMSKASKERLSVLARSFSSNRTNQQYPFPP